MTTGKTIALTRQTYVGIVMSQLFTMLSTLVILKSRDITLSTKVHLVKAMVFPVALEKTLLLGKIEGRKRRR